MSTLKVLRAQNRWISKPTEYYGRVAELLQRLDELRGRLVDVHHNPIPWQEVRRWGRNDLIVLDEMLSTCEYLADRLYETHLMHCVCHVVADVERVEDQQLYGFGEF